MHDSRSRPRVWLAEKADAAAEPGDHPMVRDDLMRTWQPGEDGRYHTRNGRHRLTWCELHARFDPVEVS